ncbi:endolytic transglycosylase MltG [Albibacterium sp.]|uniref:endolytic transglycosylase MltG n=1 Tax=Albibacterium sp. TaxID=2952885 RepID=UPI002BBD4BF9|nr:endolytic transglycosylase MltG [Albibacterium sp.]HUH18871.1 endolytic transglycosylase MltG [Albibacterium sp.]
MQKKSISLKKAIVALAVFVFILAIGIGFYVYQRYLAPNVTDSQAYLYIPTGSDFEDLMKNLDDNKIVEDTATFRWLAERKDYPLNIKAGKYKLTEGMNNRTLINHLSIGLQEPVKLRFQNIRLKQNFAGLLAKQLEPDSLAFIELLNNDSLANAYGFNHENFFTMFIPNTYEFFWNTSTEQFVERMHKEYNTFWTEERKAKAKALNLTPIEVSNLAAIVKGEALHTDEMPKIAGLYLNRLKKGMLLQADPTVIFATQDFSIRRVLNVHLRTNSPYNTYIHKGLPPGPIMMPSIASIDAVLNPQTHDYIYMCAKDDFSGYHNFATTVAQHLINARKFQKALDERNIKR